MTLPGTAQETPNPSEWESEWRRLDQEERRQADDARREELREWISLKQTHEMIKSELMELYDEVDKLVKTLPMEPITSLQLKTVNSFLGKAKSLLSGDTIIDEIEVFVTSEDKPEYRDVIMVLRQIRQGLERFETRNAFIFSSRFNDHLEEYNL